jgi:hypothetical protein
MRSRFDWPNDPEQSVNEKKQPPLPNVPGWNAKMLWCT